MNDLEKKEIENIKKELGITGDYNLEILRLLKSLNDSYLEAERIANIPDQPKKRKYLKKGK